MTSDTMFKNLGSRRLLSHSIEEQIEMAIRERKLVPGQKLPTEMELCKTFGVSRTVMREALRVLHSRQLILIQKGKGMFVNAMTAASVTDPMSLYLSLNFDESYVLDVIHARQAIEPSIAALAAEHRTPEQLISMHDNMRKLEVMVPGSPDLAAIDMEFHMLVARASGNLLMPLVVEPIHRLMPKIKLTIYGVVHDAKQSALQYHANVLAAIEAQDVNGARQAMTDHLLVAEHHSRLMLEARKEKQQSVPVTAADEPVKT
ncbi:MAG TPA: FadR/GntR family transcriptional regulator [Bacteroidota bacterium]|nr:FadR/GntR family transcriptional regulator [Bacteroidota bacterium]